jgi:hypothetical protein
MAVKEVYTVGDIIPENGIYECASCSGGKKIIRQRLKKGENFPECKGCADKEVWKKTAAFNTSCGCPC